jgi:hypothetical protein
MRSHSGNYKFGISVSRHLKWDLVIYLSSTLAGLLRGGEGVTKRT